jgi:hypothetical protein
MRGPDFVWAATGPALEAYSKHPIVKKANEPGAVMEVSEFLRAVRRIVVDFVVRRVLGHNGEAFAVSGLDDITTYYLLHRHDFGMNDAPSSARSKRPPRRPDVQRRDVSMPDIFFMHRIQRRLLEGKATLDKARSIIHQLPLRLIMPLPVGRGRAAFFAARVRDLIPKDA